MVGTSLLLWPITADRLVLPGGRDHARHRVPRGGLRPQFRGADTEELSRPQAHAAVPLLQRLPGAAVRGRGGRPLYPVIPADWQPHHRDDGELIGYVVAEENGLVVPVNLVGHPIGDAMDRFAAEELLEDAGLSYLAEPWLLRHDDGTEQRVVIVEVDADHVVVADAQFALVVGLPKDMAETVTLTVPTERRRPHFFGDYTQTGATTFVNAGSGTVDFLAGSSTATVIVDPFGDADPEPNETVILTGDRRRGLHRWCPNSATGTILNDDNPPPTMVVGYGQCGGGSRPAH